MQTDIPQATIDELRRLSAAATKGPWNLYSREDDSCFITHRCGAFDVECGIDDAELIAAMRNNIDALLAALESTQANERRYLEVRKRLTVERDGNGNWRWCIGWLKQPTENEAASWEQAEDVRKALDAALDKLAATEARHE